MEEWKKALVYPTDTLYNVMKKIDLSATQVAIVIDDNRILKGTVTDGDIRRGLLNNFNLESSIDQIMNTNPKTITENVKESKVYDLLVKQGLKLLPVIDSNNKLINVRTIKDFKSSQEHTNPVILMAGGLGTRLMPLTENTPKPLLKVGDKPILERILENFISHNFSNFYISVNYHADKIKDYFGDGSEWGCKINYIEETKRLGTAGALSLIKSEIKEDIIVMNGDLLTKTNFSKLLEFHNENAAFATMCVREYKETIPYGVIEADQHKFLGVKEKPTYSHLVNAGVYVLSPEAMSSIPNNEFFDMPTLFEKLRKIQKETCIFPIHEYWLDIGRLKDYEKANGEVAEIFNV